MSLVDGHQFKSLSQSIALMPNEQHGLFATSPISGPHREVDETWWPASLDAGSNQRLKGAVVELIEQSLPDTVGKLQLISYAN
jgi:hypothetical protein